VTRPRMTRTAIGRWAPDCPHCGAKEMGDATISLDELLEHGAPGDFVPVDDDGYAPATPRNGDFVLTCPSCDRPSVLAIDREHVKLVAARTKADERYLGGEP